MNDRWMQSYPQSYSVFEAGGCSDHLRCRIMTKPDLLKPRKPFKYTSALGDLPSFLPLVKNYWTTTEPLFNSTSALFRLVKKLKELKPILRNMRKELMGDVTRKTRETWAKLCVCQTDTLTNPSRELMEEESRAYERWCSLSRIEEKVLSQKAKVHWLDVGDGNNKQFYQAAKGREVRNSIREIKRADGSRVATQEEIKCEAVDHFSKFLGHTPADFVGSTVEEIQSLLGFECEEMNTIVLTHNVTEEEIRRVLFGMEKNKSPGPDGL